MNGSVPPIPRIYFFVLWYKCTLPHLFNPHFLCLVLLSYIYYVQCVICEKIISAVSRPINFDNPQNTLFITVEMHLSVRW